MRTEAAKDGTTSDAMTASDAAMISEREVNVFAKVRRVYIVIRAYDIPGWGPFPPARVLRDMKAMTPTIDPQGDFTCYDWLDLDRYIYIVSEMRIRDVLRCPCMHGRPR
jgi:hypothetical protein